MSQLLKRQLGEGFEINIEDSFSQIGSGSLPEETIPTKVISIVHRDIPPDKISEMFLKNNPPVLGRISKKMFLLDMRTIEDDGDFLQRTL